MMTKIEFIELENKRAEIEDTLTDIDINPKLKKKKAMEIAIKKGACNLSVHKIDYWISQGLVSPEIKVGEARNTHLYGRDQIRDLILIHHLREKGQTLTQIANLMREENLHISRKKEVFPNKTEIYFPPQGFRGMYLLRSRILTVVLNRLLREALRPGIVLHFRERHSQNFGLPDNFARLTSQWIDLLEADQYVGNFRKGDIIGYISPEPDREVLFPEFHTNNLVKFGIHDWLRISVKLAPPYQQYDLLLGFPHGKPTEEIFIPYDQFESTIVALLLKMVTLDFPMTKEQISVKDEQGQIDYSTILNTVVDLIPNLSDTWEYCAVLTSGIEKSDHLRVIAFSRDFPRAIRQDVNNLLVESGQLLTGWVYKFDYPIVVQHTTGENDPRIAHQHVEKTTAAIAIPTRAQGRKNGVIYVGTRYEIRNGNIPFGDPEIRVLTILSDIIGEVIERNRNRKHIETTSFLTISRPQITFQSWAKLEETIQKQLQQIVQLDIEPRTHDNLHITIVRVETADELRSLNPTISNWLINHILHTAREFYLKNELGDPIIFVQEMRFPKKFVCFLPKLIISDEEDRKLRDKLRYLLSSINITFSYNKQLRIITNVWSMPFRYTGLITRMHKVLDSDSADIFVAKEIMSEVEDALVIIPKIEQGHKYEAESAFANALEQYLTAYLMAPHNRYIIRHIAKTYAKVGDYMNASEWWKKLLVYEPQSKHYRRYAQTLALHGLVADACENYEIAHKLDKGDSDIFLEWGDLLMIQGDYKNAIEKYEEALKLTTSYRDLLWLRIAEAHFLRKDTNSAISSVNLVLARNPDNQEARRMILKIDNYRRNTI